MKHILIYILIALVFFGLIELYFFKNNSIVQQKSNEVTMVGSGNEAMPSVGMVLNGLDTDEKVAFRAAVTGRLQENARLSVADSLGSEEIQLTYCQKLIAQGCTCLIVEPVNARCVDALAELASGYGVPMILLGQRPTAGQQETCSRLYSVGYAEEDEMTRLADLISGYWKNNRETMDSLVEDDILYYAVVSDYGFENSGKAEELTALLAERGCEAKFVRDTVTEYLNYDLERVLDNDYNATAELILFADSADAEKAYSYFRDPTEYPSGKSMGIQLAVMDMDTTAYNLYKEGKVLFATGNGGMVLGQVTADLARQLLAGETPLLSSSIAQVANEGRTFLCNPLTLRSMIEQKMPDLSQEE